METYLKNRAALQAITSAELKARMKNKSVLVLDVRPEEEYRAGHIAGARSIPVDDLEGRLKELPKGTEIVAYCRGPYCVFADEAVAFLRTRGYQAARLAVGFPDWKAQGRPVVSRAT